MAVLFIGGLEEIRTPDPHNANVVRSQLRYKPRQANYTVLRCVCQADSVQRNRCSINPFVI